MAAESTTTASAPSSKSFEVEEAKADVEDDSRPFVGSGSAGGPAECIRKNCASGGTGAMVACVVLGAAVGLIVNVSVSDREVLAFWLGFPGTLFLRALKCLVTPMIFCE